MNEQPKSVVVIKARYRQPEALLPGCRTLIEAFGPEDIRQDVLGTIKRGRRENPNMETPVQVILHGYRILVTRPQDAKHLLRVLRAQGDEEVIHRNMAKLFGSLPAGWTWAGWDETVILTTKG